MNTTDRAKFMSIQTGDTIVYTDEQGAHCEAEVTGWKNHQGDPAVLIEEHGAQVVTLPQVLSRTRHGNTKEWRQSS